MQDSTMKTTTTTIPKTIRRTMILVPVVRLPMKPPRPPLLPQPQPLRLRRRRLHLPVNVGNDDDLGAMSRRHNNHQQQ
jgi:hypothetical protein